MTLFNQPSKRCQNLKSYLIKKLAQTNIKKYLFFCFFLCTCTQTKAGGWKGGVSFDVKNYEGKIGDSSVHISLQEKTKKDGSALIKGSYYYNRYRSPILLNGEYREEEIVLCEVENREKYLKLLSEGKDRNFKNCEFRLKVDEEDLTGQWKSGNTTYPIALTQTNYLDSGGAYVEKGEIEIPFWGQTREHFFIGIYKSDGKEVDINKIKVMSKKSGEVIQVIDPQLYDCGFGFYMTYIYDHVTTENDTTIELQCYRSEYVGNTRFYQYNRKQGKYVYIKDYLDKHYK